MTYRSRLQYSKYELLTHWLVGQGNPSSDLAVSSHHLTVTRTEHYGTRQRLLNTITRAFRNLTLAVFQEIPHFRIKKGITGFVILIRILHWRMLSSWMLRRVALVRTDVSEECIASIIRVTRIGEQGTTLAVTSNRNKLRRNTMYYVRAAGFSC
jgi:hypothetical protein